MQSVVAGRRTLHNAAFCKVCGSQSPSSFVPPTAARPAGLQNRRYAKCAAHRGPADCRACTGRLGRPGADAAVRWLLWCGRFFSISALCAWGAAALVLPPLPAPCLALRANGPAARRPVRPPPRGGPPTRGRRAFSGAAGVPAASGGRVQLPCATAHCSRWCAGRLACNCRAQWQRGRCAGRASPTPQGGSQLPQIRVQGCRVPGAVSAALSSGAAPPIPRNRGQAGRAAPCRPRSGC